MRNPISTTISQFPTTTKFNSATRTTAKRPKLTYSPEKINHHHHHQSPPPLLPGLPDHIAQLCLSKLQPSILSSVCQSWRKLIYSPDFPPFLSLYALFIESQPNSSTNSINFCSFDPIAAIWNKLPTPPLKFLHQHPSFISRSLPVQSVAVDGKLVILAATGDQLSPALSQPLIFDTKTQNWTEGPPLGAPRRWCAAGGSRTAVYVASGMGAHYSTEVSKSVEKLDLNVKRRHQWRWENMNKLKDGKFCREAIEAVSWKGKLCMVNVKGDSAKQGTVYDVVSDFWSDMPPGMVAGWRGPAAAMDEEILYCVDETKGLLKKYNEVKDCWLVVVENEMMKGAQQIVAAGGKVCVLCCDGGGVVVVDAAAPERFWVVEAPPEFQAVGIHVLPRLSRPEFQSK